ncbi:hypothetical protein AX774_g685 [Zancudomyces culisetae]|uniref:Uncharacterized protein n=1 Tax=Zancudomyces culisetae TaxID=1213189 RepID=A0A1R1PXW2_ZANCU|nr:hypothetical protein AX774_g685 [Zancudomyces culisetae]|eukprot:OMH85758.1 hypothetical protein AX774_g685 [Zancudomyces culisetae]
MQATWDGALSRTGRHTAVPGARRKPKIQSILTTSRQQSTRWMPRPSLSTSRVGAIKSDVHQDCSDVGSPRHRSVCISTEPEGPEVHELVSGPPSSSNERPATPLESTDEQKQELEARRVEIKRARYVQKGLNDNSVALFTDNQRISHLDTRYSRIQLKFIKFCDERGVSASDFSYVDLINFCCYVSTLVLWGINDTLSFENPTRNLCFLQAICGFKRPSDIERIDNWKTTMTNDILNLVVIQPKEKRMSLSITKSVSIHKHSVDYMCPVATYSSYKKHFTSFAFNIAQQHPRK